MRLPIPTDYPPMEALSVAQIPTEPGWQYEPKWDGFRCLAFRDGDQVALQSKSGQPLARYFPDVVDALRSLTAKRFVLDGEIVVPEGKKLSFDQLLQRIHPAESRVRKLSSEHPASYIVFDLLADERSKGLVDLPLQQRRPRLEAFAARFFSKSERVLLSPATPDLKVARRWFKSAGGSLDGIIAKRLETGYRSGERTGMLKIKPVRTIECVVGGFRYATRGKVVGSLLLGLYDDAGLLHHVGYTSSLKAAERARVTPELEALVKPPGFTGRAPGGPSRWSTARSTEWQPLQPKRVVEIEYDHLSGGRLRHGAKFLRWRPDKSPRQCTFDQIAAAGEGAWKLLRSAGRQGRGVRKPTSSKRTASRAARTAK